MVRAPHARNGVTELVHDTSLLEVRAKLPRSEETVTRDGMRLFSMAAGLMPSTSIGSPVATRVFWPPVSDPAWAVACEAYRRVVGRFVG